MRRQQIDIRTTTLAGPAAVYALITDGASWPDWSPIDSFELEKEGVGGPEGVGAVRVFRNGRIEGRDTIVELVADRRLGYTHVSDLPIKGYRADIDLEPDGTGTRIRWRASFRATVPGTGPVLRWALGRFLRQCADGLADAAPGRAGSSIMDRPSDAGWSATGIDIALQSRSMRGQV
jgi:Polyketide cyclase / dehydrase and lipid transport